ncbi:selenium binding protein [Ancylostoma ceylanicum]|uniref:Selenium binding protein n=1 Tax=Ancylostoma ceylanicum TaxID=53326 RepID=A0A0D6L745_9BILA|nr:selenium binding protein [Ancylostoma ceylanicum]
MPCAPMRAEYNKQDREKLAVLNCPHSVGFHPDRLAIVDLDENSENYCKVVSILSFPDVGDEPGRINWTRSARSLETMTEVPRTHMVVPCMNSDRVYIVEVGKSDMKLVKTIDAEILRHYDISCPYAVHVLPLKGAPVHIATMGDKCGHGKGDFLLIDRNSFEIRERHNRTGFTGFGGDFSFQTRRNLLIASEWGHPRLFRNGFTRSEIENECNHAFACSAVGSSVFHLHMNSVNGKWSADKVFQVQPIQVENWLSSEMPALLTDLVISMNDKFAYVAGWLHGCVWQLDISDPFRTSAMNKVVLGGLLGGISDAFVKSPSIIQLVRRFCVSALVSSLDKTTSLQDRSHQFGFATIGRVTPRRTTCIRGTIFRGGPAFLQLSVDGKRLYVGNSFYKQWDAQFYPELIANGGQIARIDIDSAGKMSLSDSFLIDLKDMEGGPFLARDLRFFNGDSTSDNFL